MHSIRWFWRCVALPKFYVRGKHVELAKNYRLRTGLNWAFLCKGRFINRASAEMIIGRFLNHANELPPLSAAQPLIRISRKNYVHCIPWMRCELVPSSQPAAHKPCAYHQRSNKLRQSITWAIHGLRQFNITLASIASWCEVKRKE